MKKIFQIEPSIGIKEKQELLSVIESGWYTEAKKTRKFEKMFTEFIGIKYACAVTSGTVALYLGLKSLGIGYGDEVIVPDLTFVASPNAVEMTGAKPVLVDIEPIAMNLDFNKLMKLITKKTKAVMLVAHNGRSININKLSKFAKKNNLFLIEDAAHAIGSYYGKHHIGTQSDVAAFSFSIPKIITTGQGGMVITNKKNIYKKLLTLKDFGRSFEDKQKMNKVFVHDTIGYNFKFTEFQAAMGVAQMNKLSSNIKKKKELYKFYKKHLSHIPEIEFVETNLKEQTIWFVDILLKTEKLKLKLMKFLEQKNIQTRPFFPPLHTLPPYKMKDDLFKVSSSISKRGLFLPSSTTLTKSQLRYVCRKINEFFEQ
ncbi:DegT/DnrJ/EryC1/StrS family aminotransferase [Nitrosopumilus piranensis]|uniref:Uncharacterized protein n=1 Tax=Nitrosopumilus piranensis TaxID=1582439 RepID=A0A0C5BNK3_9ARCH|nr:DegT/DnrJ/EryC1/StrS aminotransferase family protein [Nitrosopumilus piranensis]AJM91288.1 hypothetical protein NPIRD3C_0064 [Nitrosopumilus piranensis]